MSHSTEIGTLLNSKFVYKTSSLNSWLNIFKRIKPHGGESFEVKGLWSSLKNQKKLRKWWWKVWSIMENVKTKRILPEYFFYNFADISKIIWWCQHFLVNYTWGLFLYLFQTKFSLIRMTHSHKSWHIHAPIRHEKLRFSMG